MRTEDSYKAVAFSAAVFILFGGYFAYAAFLTGQPKSLPFVQAIAAKDGEDDDEEEDDGDEEENEDDEDNDDEDDRDEDSSHSDKAKKEAEKKREALKKAAERAREAAKRSGDHEQDDYVNGVKVRGDGSIDDADEDGLEDEEDEGHESGDDNEDREAMFKDQAKTLERLNKKIAQAEEKILKKQSEGVDVSAALAQLALAKESLNSVDAAFAANELDRIKMLAKETEKLAHFARGKTLHDSEHIAKDIAKVEKRIVQVKARIILLSRLGGDASSYLSSLAEAETAFGTAKTEIALGGDGLLTGLAALEAAERRVKSIKNSVEGALFAMGASDDDDEFEKEHGIEVEDTSDDLSELADADEDHRALGALALAHKTEAAKVALLARSLGERNRIIKGLFGNDSDVLDELRSEAAINENRIAAMQAAADEVEDNELNRLMNEKIGELKTENANLMSFISAQSAGTGVFGWFFRLF